MAQAGIERCTKIERDLGALTSCDITTAWSLLKENVEKQIGKRNFACIPYVTEGLLYDITSVFVKIDQAGGAGRRIRTYRPLGLIEHLLMKEHSWEVWHNISERIPPSTKTQNNLVITLEDAERKTSVSATFSEVSTRTMPKDFTPIGQVVLNPSIKPDLVKAKKIYFINEVIVAESVRLVIVVNDVDRVVSYTKPQPIAFRYAKYSLDTKKMVVQRHTVPRVSSLRTTWIRLNVKEDAHVNDHHSAIDQGQSVDSVETADDSVEAADDTVSADTVPENVLPMPEEPINISREEENHAFELESENVVAAN